MVCIHETRSKRKPKLSRFSIQFRLTLITIFYLIYSISQFFLEGETQLTITGLTTDHKSYGQYQM